MALVDFKFALLATVLFPLIALSAESPRKGAQKSPPKSKTTAMSCQKKAEDLVRQTALRMGLSQPFGIHFSQEKGDGESEDPSWTMLRSGTFIVDDGYVSNSGATVAIRDFEGKCEIVRLTVAVGG